MDSSVGRKISKKVQQAAEKYLASYDSSREQLTDKQWEVVVNHVKSQRFIKVKLAIILSVAVFEACLFVWAWRLTDELIAKVVPDKTMYVIDGETQDPIDLAPNDIKTYLQKLSNISFDAGATFSLAILLFAGVAVAFAFRKRRLKMIEAVIERKKESKVASEEDQPPLN